MSRRWRWPAARRGEFFPVAPAPPASAPAVFVPVFTRQEAARAVLARRGRFASTPLAIPVAPARVTRDRFAVPQVRRGRFAWVPPQTQAATTGPLVPAPLVRERIGGLPVRRGRFTTVPKVGAAPAVTPTLPEFARQTGIIKPGAARHGRFLYTPPAPSGPVPRSITSRRPSAPGAGRGRIWHTVLDGIVLDATPHSLAGATNPPQYTATVDSPQFQGAPNAPALYATTDPPELRGAPAAAQYASHP